MEVASSAPQIPLRSGTPLPLKQLVESRSRASAPNPLESKIYGKLKSNRVIQAEPPELHFSGFELGKDYVKILKLINISSEVMNIHILPTQTKYFQTTYTKKYRLIPGLAYALKVRLRPDEWRYFYDCIRVHCKGEENLLIPVHAYPVIDSLRIPPRVDLSAVPLGQSVCHAIPLRCSCPIDFEFQVYVVQPHEAFSIHPLTGVIPANGEERIIVTFRPFHYETCQVTIQLIISQFNTKPYLCTITGSSAPHLALRDAAPAGNKGASPATQVPPRSKTKSRSARDGDKSKTLSDKASVEPGPKPPPDACTPAGVAKMLISDADKLSSKYLREAISCGSTVGLQTRQMKEALFLKKVQQNVEEQANQLSWKVHLGKEPMSEHTRRQIAEESEIAQHEYMVKRGGVWQEEDFAAGQPQLSSRRVLCEAGQAPKGAPSFQFSSSLQWELRQRALRRFQQAARKIVMRCRVNRRLTCLKKVPSGLRNSPVAKKVEKTTCEPKISPEAVFPLSFPGFRPDDPLAGGNLAAALPVDPVDVTVTTRIPFFKLRVSLQPYKPVSAWDALTSYTPTTLARPLRIGAPLVPNEVGVQPSTAAALKAREEGQHEKEEEDAEAFSFSPPEALLRPLPANPLRIFDPAPGLQAYKPTPKYLESDLEFHLCPLPRYPTPEGKTCGGRTQTPHTQKSLDREEVITGIVTWKDFDSIASKCLSNQPALAGDCALHRSVDYSADILPLAGPPPLTGPPDDPAPGPDQTRGDSRVQLTPEMIRAVFLSAEALVSNSNLTIGTTVRHQRELEMEATYRSERNQMGKRVTSRLKQLSGRKSPGEDCA